MAMKRCSFTEATHIRVKGIISLIRTKGKDDYGDKFVILNNGQRIRLSERRIELFEVEYYKYEPDGPTTPEWNAVEREIILADIAYLKQKEIESGDWAKWEKDQKNQNRNIVTITVTVRAENIPTFDFELDENGNLVTPPTWPFTLINGIAAPRYSTGQITRDLWEICVGRAPINDDLERANCPMEGTIGHMGCGWCSECSKPRWMCGHRLMRS
jgi:hypothetical protein